MPTPAPNPAHREEAGGGEASRPVRLWLIVSSARRKARARPSLAGFETLQEGLMDVK